MKSDKNNLYKEIFNYEPQKVLVEIKYIISFIKLDKDMNLFEKVFSDTVLLFKGKYPGYRASNTKYHDLPHTASVVLTVVRLIHGSY